MQTYMYVCIGTYAYKWRAYSAMIGRTVALILHIGILHERIERRISGTCACMLVYRVGLFQVGTTEPKVNPELNQQQID